MNIRALVAEAVGTFVLVFIGSLGVATYVVSAGQQGNALVALLVVPFAFGLGLMAAIGIAGHASGGHFNAAVTLAALFDRRLDWMNAIGYVIAQLIGAFTASLALLLITSKDVVGVTVNQPPGTELSAFAVEAILTAIFIAVILTVTRKGPGQAIIVIPLTLLAIHIVGLFTSGASVNPTRSLAPAVVSGLYDSLWVYLTAPFVGSILGWGIYRFLTPPDEEQDEGVDDGDDEFDELVYDNEDDRQAADAPAVSRSRIEPSARR